MPSASPSAVLALLLATCLSGAEFFVSPAGSDTNRGNKARPFRTLARAQKAARAAGRSAPVTVWLRSGNYYLPETLVLAAEDSGTAVNPVVWQAAAGEKPVVSGGVSLKLRWRPYKNGIFEAKVPGGLETDQLFINGERQHMARFPNFDANIRHFNGYSPEAFSKERAARWADPKGGFIHAMHRHEWGDFHYVITGKDAEGNVTYEGGWQNNRRLGMHAKYRMVENIFEELDAPGEWFLNRKTSTLYFYPPAGLKLETAMVEAVRLPHLIEFRGDEKNPVRFITLKGISFRHAARTFMDNKEPLLRSDWTTYRGGAIFFNGAENSGIEDCEIDQVGGNAVFVNKYNRRVTIRGTIISKAGGNAIAFVGDPAAVRSPLFEYEERQKLGDIDKTPGPKSNNYPAESLVDDCLIYESGRVEKQTAGVQISMARGITIRHTSIYQLPRAGINISEGTWGGHIIENCDIFDTVLETGDHGSFNSWGRDRFWLLSDVDMNTITTGPNRDLPLLDMVEPIILRNNRWRCDHGWDIDLDDGSTRYEIRNNLTLNGGIKNREGFYRTVENNIMVNNSFHPHVWFRDSEDVFRRNIVFTTYRPIRVPKPWGKEIDYNLLHVPGATESVPAAQLHAQSGRDEHSIRADAMFMDPAKGDYRVRPGSPALQLGFQNFPMDQFGVRSPRLKALARTPKLPDATDARPSTTTSGRDSRTWNWEGVTVRNIVGIGEVSAAGLPGEAGVLVVEAPAGTVASGAGIRTGDVIVQVDGKAINGLPDLVRIWQAGALGETHKVTVFRDQRRETIQVTAESK